MGKRSREMKRRWQERTRGEANPSGAEQAGTYDRDRLVAELKDQIIRDHDAAFEIAEDIPLDVQEAHLKDIIAFESVSSGVSLFQGLEQHGVKLPRPETLSEKQCITKVLQVFRALAANGVLLIGYEEMDPISLYAKLWHETLWEGCYLENRPPGALTMIDVSRSMSGSDWRNLMEDLKKAPMVH
jgi:hypothetical protein